MHHTVNRVLHFFVYCVGFVRLNVSLFSAVIALVYDVIKADSDKRHIVS